MSSVKKEEVGVKVEGGEGSQPMAAGKDDSMNASVTYDEDEMPIPNGIEEVDEDQLEETGETLDLDMSKAGNQVWLVKLTPKLANIWKKPGFLNGQELGQIKIQRGTTPPKILLTLNEELPEHKGIDDEYQLKLTKQLVDNEYIFSETEFDQFKKQKLASYKTEVVDMPTQPKMDMMDVDEEVRDATWTRSLKGGDFQRMETGAGTTDFGSGPVITGDSDRKFVPYAKTIPKKTEFVGKVVHECQVIPTKLSPARLKSKMIDQRRRLKTMTRRHHINYLKNANAGILQGRAGPNIHTGSTITLSREVAAKREAARSEGRASRMDKERMMKLLFDLFNQYDYWTLKGLREKTNQPEAYLKECLDSIAVMERKGPYALKYRLKEEYKRSRDVERKARQGINEEESDKEEDDEDDNVEMEDVAEL